MRILNWIEKSKESKKYKQKVFDPRSMGNWKPKTKPMRWISFKYYDLQPKFNDGTVAGFKTKEARDKFDKFHDTKKGANRSRERYLKWKADQNALWKRLAYYNMKPTRRRTK